ncbi:MAG TPA: CooT family nickel-binding protein [Coriobacteriia bacterium]|nr:CooT family nickel-binding protein [Coriobacteriia bacterium]
MCEAKVIITGQDGREIETVEDVTTIVPEDAGLRLYDLYGANRVVDAVLKEVRLLDHTVVLSSTA